VPLNPIKGSSIVAANIFNSQGACVAVVVGSEIYDLAGNKLYDLRGLNIYLPSGELVGHMNDVRGSDKRLARSTDRLFPAHRPVA
jgi:hypothetical protein